MNNRTILRHKDEPKILVVILSKEDNLLYLFREQKPEADYMYQASEVARDFLNSGWKMVKSVVV